MSPFDSDDVMNRLFDKLDMIGEKIDDLCNRMTKQETKYDLHIEDGKNRAERKDKVFYGVIAIFGIVISVIELMRSGIIG